jgi:hypothetical protein
MGLTQLGTARLYGTGGGGAQVTLAGTFAGADVREWTATFTGAEVKEIKVDGTVSTLVIAPDWKIEMSCQVTFLGTATAGIAAAGTTATLTGFPNLTLGGQSDALNSGGGKWLCTGGSITAVSDDASTGTCTFVKYKSITLA